MILPHTLASHVSGSVKSCYAPAGQFLILSAVLQLHLVECSTLEFHCSIAAHNWQCRPALMTNSSLRQAWCGGLQVLHASTAIADKSCVHAAGVWENATDAYLNEVLVRKTGSAAALCVLYHGVLQRLFLAGEIDFGARIDCR